MWARSKRREPVWRRVSHGRSCGDPSVVQVGLDRPNSKLPLIPIRSWNYRQYNVRRVLRVVINRIERNRPASVVVQWLSRIRIHIEPRKIAARDIDTDTMSLRKHQRRWVHLDGER